MAHIDEHLTQNIELGAAQISGQESLEIVTTDGGQEVRNSRAENVARRWEIALPVVNVETGDTEDYDAVRLIWSATLRGLHSFNFHCFVDDEVVKVRFASELSITAPAPHIRHIDTFTIKEVLGE